jgi:hypothetical protein
MEKRLSMALIAGLILSAGWLYGQDSSDDSDASDTSTASVATDTSPGDVSVTDVSNVSPGNDAASLTPMIRH